MSADPRATARHFVRSLNILLKFARLYEFGHVRTAAQFETTWKELRTALNESGESGLLLGASGTQILLDGVPLGAAAAERSFAQLLSGSGIASIHFAQNLSQAHFARFVRAFPNGNSKSGVFAEQLKAALAGESSIKVNEIRYIAEDSSIAGAKIAANLTAKVLGAQGDKFKDFLDDPNRLLQMILAAEGSRGGAGESGGSGPGFGAGGGVPGVAFWAVMGERAKPAAGAPVCQVGISGSPQRVRIPPPAKILPVVRMRAWPRTRQIRFPPCPVQQLLSEPGGRLARNGSRPRRCCIRVRKLTSPSLSLPKRKSARC